MGSYGPNGCDWLTVDSAVAGEPGRNKHPTGAGAGRNVGIPLAAGTVGAYTTNNQRVTRTGFFSGYTRTAGDVFVPLSGRGFDFSRTYTISSSAANFIVLTAGQVGLPTVADAIADGDPTGITVSNITGYIVPVGSVIAGASDVTVYGVLVTKVDAIDSIINILTYDTGATLSAIPVVTGLGVPMFFPIGSNQGAGQGKGFLAKAESGSTTLAFNVYFRRVQ